MITCETDTFEKYIVALEIKKRYEQDLAIAIAAAKAAMEELEENIKKYRRILEDLNK